MANTKTFILDWNTTGLTSYGIFVRAVDEFQLNDADGDFASAPADPYISFTEDSVLKGRYQLDESRVAWNDGTYTYAVYNQAGGSPAPVSDTIIGTGSVQIEDDREVVLDTSLLKWIANKLSITDNGDGTKTVILFDDDSVTPLKTWIHTTATGVRAKAT